MVNTSLPQKPPHAFLVLHFGDQCPWRLWVVEQAQKAALATGRVVEVIDVLDQPAIASHHRLFFPFMTVIDGEIRLPSPIPAERLVRIANIGMTASPAVTQFSTPEGQAERIEPLTVENIGDTCCLCIPPGLSDGCRAKQTWAQKMSPKISSGIFGFAAYQGDDVVGAVEFLPASLIPYPLPEKHPTSAFITCIYSMEDKGKVLDYRGQVLDKLLEYLPTQGFRKVQVIAGRYAAFPNGPAPFFITRGFVQVNELDKISLGEVQEEIVLLEKTI